MSALVNLGKLGHGSLRRSSFSEGSATSGADTIPWGDTYFDLALRGFNEVVHAAATTEHLLVRRPWSRRSGRWPRPDAPLASLCLCLLHSATHHELLISLSRKTSCLQRAQVQPVLKLTPALRDKLEAIRSSGVHLGFGLHTGWAIEGAIGSKHKIDASYLSPHVNLASRLQVRSPTLQAASKHRPSCTQSCHATPCHATKLATPSSPIHL